MKMGWSTKKLGEICDIERGGSPRPIQNFITTASNGINWIKIGDATASDKYIYKTEQKIKPEGANRSRMVYEGDFILSNSMSFGRPYIMKTTGCIHDGWLVLRQPKVDPDYLYHVLSSDLVFNQFDRLAAGSTVRNLNIGLAKSVEIPYPPLPEQKRIVGILDKAFEGIATAKANAEKNLQNARALFQTAFAAVTGGSIQLDWRKTTVANVALQKKGAIRTGPFGSQLLHTEFVEEGIAVLGIDNAVHNEFRWGKKRCITSEKFEQLARYQVRPGDVLITIMGTCGRCAIVPEDVPIAINTKHLCCITLDPRKCLPEFLHAYFLYHPLAQEFLTRMAKGSIMAGLNMGIIKELPLLLPPLNLQVSIVDKLKGLREETQRLALLYQRKLAALEALKKSLLQQAFTGQLTEKSHKAVVIPFPKKIPNITSTDLHAGVLAIAYQLHERKNKQQSFGHVKAEKIVHLVEARLGIDLGRNPIKDAAGPNDYPHLKAVEHRAKMAGFFVFQGSKKIGYQFAKRQQFDALVEKTRGALGDHNQALDDLLELLASMNTQQAEIFATVYAAWNNLLLDGLPVSDERIVFEARENWHADKLAIPREKFFKAIHWMQDKGVIPGGTGKKVHAKPGKAK
jgi:type I restriction enzyme, S subunit